MFMLLKPCRRGGMWSSFGGLSEGVGQKLVFDRFPVVGPIMRPMGCVPVGIGSSDTLCRVLLVLILVLAEVEADPEWDFDEAEADDRSVVVVEPVGACDRTHPTMHRRRKGKKRERRMGEGREGKWKWV